MCLLGLIASVFIGCDKDEDGRKVIDYKEYVLTVASKKVPGVLGIEGNNLLSEVYAVKKESSETWESQTYIGGFEFEEGNEYKVKISATSYLDERMGQPAWTEYDLLEVMSKEKKDSEGVPLHFVPEWFYEDRFLPEYQYAVEADNKEMVEADLKENSIIPLEYHYMLYRDGDNLLKWIAIKDKDDAFGPVALQSKNVKPEELPESYKILSVDGNIVSYMQWTFSDESGHGIVYPSFDVFIGYAKKVKSVGPTPDVAYLYKDLTNYYKDKFPEAGVKTVVVRYAMEIR